MRVFVVVMAIACLICARSVLGQVYPVTYSNVGDWPAGNIVMVVTPTGPGGQGTPMTQMYDETTYSLIYDPILIDINYESGFPPSQIAVYRWSYTFTRLSGDSVFRCAGWDTVGEVFTINDALLGRDPCDPVGFWCSSPYQPEMGGTGVFSLSLDYAGSGQTTLSLGSVRIISPDINGDGTINLADNGLFAADATNYNIRSDFVYNGVINLADVGFFSAHYGDSCP